jgi:hypothetical protein
MRFSSITFTVLVAATHISPTFSLSYDSSTIQMVDHSNADQGSNKGDMAGHQITGTPADPTNNGALMKAEATTAPLVVPPAPAARAAPAAFLPGVMPPPVVLSTEAAIGFVNDGLLNLNNIVNGADNQAELEAAFKILGDTQSFLQAAAGPTFNMNLNKLTFNGGV